MRAHPHLHSQARLCGCCFGKVNLRWLAHPIIVLSPSKPHAASQISSAERHLQNTATYQSLSYVLHNLLLVTEMENDKGLVPALCVSQETLLFLLS